MPTPLEVLQQIFGYAEFRPGQEKIINTVLAGRDCIGVMPTGAGKSLTFQIPARIKPGTVLVLSPLISLMKDQVDALLANGFKATVINSTLAAAERRERLSAFRRGEYELVYLAPEALEGSFAISCKHARFPWWWWTKPIASATGDMISARLTANSRG
jgi:ATP-dependent DNA helicase RecQ